MDLSRNELVCQNSSPRDKRANIGQIIGELLVLLPEINHGNNPVMFVSAKARWGGGSSTMTMPMTMMTQLTAALGLLHKPLCQRVWVRFVVVGLGGPGSSRG